MKLLHGLYLVSALVTSCSAIIIQNGQVRETNFVDTKGTTITTNSTGWTTYPANATELSYKGRWDSKHISWWAAPGLKFAFEGQDIAITFGELTSPGVLVAYRTGGLDWQMTNITAGATHHLVTPDMVNTTLPSQLPLIFEMRVTNYAYGVQVSAVHVSAGSKLIKVPNYSKNIEFIGDSIISGMHTSYEAFSGFGYNIGAGFGNIEYSITAYPGICLTDAPCWEPLRGHTYQWHQAFDPSPRAQRIYGNNSEPYDFSAHQPADLVIMHIGTNDGNAHNNLTAAQFVESYNNFIPMLHKVWPEAQIVIMGLYTGFERVGSTWVSSNNLNKEIYGVYEKFKPEGYVHYFNTSGILQHNDVSPAYHPSDFGHIKIAMQMMQFIRQTFGWEYGATGPEVQHETMYWNDEGAPPPA